MPKWNALAKIEKARKDIVVSHHFYLLLTIIAIILLIALTQIMLGVGIGKYITIITILVLAFLIGWEIVGRFEQKIKNEIDGLHQYFYAYLSIYEDRDNFAEFVGERKREKKESDLDEILQHVPNIL